MRERTKFYLVSNETREGRGPRGRGRGLSKCLLQTFRYTFVRSLYDENVLSEVGNTQGKEDNANGCVEIAIAEKGLESD